MLHTVQTEYEEGYECRGNLKKYDYICPSTSKFTFLSRSLIEKIIHLLVHTSLHLFTYTRIKTTTSEAHSDMTLLAHSLCYSS